MNSVPTEAMDPYRQGAVVVMFRIFNDDGRCNNNNFETAEHSNLKSISNCKTIETKGLAHASHMKATDRKEQFLCEHMLPFFVSCDRFFQHPLLLSYKREDSCISLKTIIRCFDLLAANKD
jgi:hypothetical protein